MTLDPFGWRPVANRAEPSGTGGLDDHPAATFWTQWFTGVAVPIALLGYAGWRILAGEIWVPFRGRRGYFGTWLDGTELWCAAGVMLGVSVVLHAHAFWGQRYAPDHAGLVLAKAGGLLIALACGCVWGWRWLTTG